MNRLHVRLFCTRRLRRPGLVTGRYEVFPPDPQARALWLLSVTCGPLVLVVLRGEQTPAGRN